MGQKNTLFQNVALWHANYSELKAPEEKQIGEKFPTFPLFAYNRHKRIKVSLLLLYQEGQKFITWDNFRALSAREGTRETYKTKFTNKPLSSISFHILAFPQFAAPRDSRFFSSCPATSLKIGYSSQMLTKPLSYWSLVLPCDTCMMHMLTDLYLFFSC